MGFLGPVGDAFAQIFQWGISTWLILLICVLLFGGTIIVILVRNKLTYAFRIRIYRTRESGKVKELNWVGGYITRKNAPPFFRMKPRKNSPFKHVDLIETPKPEWIDEEDRIYYKQIDVGCYIQLRREFIFTKEELIKFTPVESDVKYGAIIAVQRIRDVLKTEPTWKKLLAYFTLIILAVVFIVAYWMLMDKCGGAAPIPK